MSGTYKTRQNIVQSLIVSAKGTLKSASGDPRKLYGVLIQPAGAEFMEIVGFLGSDRSVDRWVVGPAAE